MTKAISRGHLTSNRHAGSCHPRESRERCGEPVLCPLEAAENGVFSGSLRRHFRGAILQAQVPGEDYPSRYLWDGLPCLNNKLPQLSSTALSQFCTTQCLIDTKQIFMSL
jgi:hypothetical protein